jgi:hypothetical protein
MAIAISDGGFLTCDLSLRWHSAIDDIAKTQVRFRAGRRDRPPLNHGAQVNHGAQAGEAAIIEAWKLDGNESRPHTALGDRTPLEYSNKSSISAKLQDFDAAENPLDNGTTRAKRFNDDGH